jgi:hypothetical protein
VRETAPGAGSATSGLVPTALADTTGATFVANGGHSGPPLECDQLTRASLTPRIADRASPVRFIGEGPHRGLRAPGTDGAHSPTPRIAARWAMDEELERPKPGRT